MFVDDFWLAFILSSCESDVPPRLVLLNTEQSVGDPKLAQTTFWLGTDEDQQVGTPYLHLDQGGHEPTPEEDSLAPFYQDPSQRILTVKFFRGGSVFVMKTEALLELARECGGTELGWGQWRAHVVEVADNSEFLWVSGPRLFCMRRKHRNPWVDVYDFSPRASALHVEEVANYEGETVRTMEPSLDWHGLLWHADGIYFANSGHDSIVFVGVNVLAPKT